MSEEPFFAILRMRIRTARLAKGLRQEEVAELTGLQLRSYARFEAVKPDRGRFNPSIQTVRIIARALQLELATLMSEPLEPELALLRKHIPARVQKRKTPRV